MVFLSLGPFIHVTLSRSIAPLPAETSKSHSAKPMIRRMLLWYPTPMALIRPGDFAPDFTLPNSDGREFQLSAYRGNYQVLLLFLPAAFTPICTTELPALYALQPRFVNEAQTFPYAVTVDTVFTNGQWARACGAAPGIVLSDSNPQGAVSRAYGAWMPADSMSSRSTVIIGKDGRVKYAADAGKFGKRSVPELLAIATLINGGRPVASVPVLQPLTIPVLYVMDGCPYCEQALAVIQRRGIGHRVVVRRTSEPGVMHDVLARNPNGGVPLMVMPDGTMAQGGPDVAATLEAVPQ